MRLALFQCEPGQPGDVAGNRARLDQTAQAAAAQGASLLVLPEMYCTGYNIGADRVAQLAEDADGPGAGAVADIARRHGLAILYGYPERNPQGQPFNSVQLIDRDGRRRTNYRKTHLYGDLDRAQFSASDTLGAVFEFEGWRIGLLICFDMEFPETVRCLALAGAELILVPTANMLPYTFVAETLAPCRAYENQVFLAYANYLGREGGLDYCGQSCVVAPDGELLVRAQDCLAGGSAPGQLLFADIERSRLDDARAQFSYLSLRRPSLYC
jgi:predicted amidohydrolase